MAKFIDADRIKATGRQAKIVRRIVEEAPAVEAIPAAWIRRQIVLPENAGHYSSALSKMLRKWREESG